RQGGPQLGNQGNDRNGQSSGTLGIAQQQHAGPRHQGNGYRQNGQMCFQAGHESGSTPSTWSVPDRPRAASRTTRNSARVAKPMTMAVSTSACGRGSAY